MALILRQYLFFNSCKNTEWQPSISQVFLTFASTNHITIMKKAFIILILSGSLFACQESLEDRCYREAKEYTQKKCPAPIAPNIVIDSMAFDRATRTLHYYYTIKNNTNGEISLDQSAAYSMLLDQVKNATSTKEYKDAGFNFTYTYYTENETKKALFEATFTKKDYQ